MLNVFRKKKSMAAMNISISANRKKKFHRHQHIIQGLILKKLTGEISKCGKQCVKKKNKKRVRRKLTGKKKSITFRLGFVRTENGARSN